MNFQNFNRFVIPTDLPEDLVESFNRGYRAEALLTAILRELRALNKPPAQPTIETNSPPTS